MSAGLKTCTVVYAMPACQHLWTIEVPKAASVAEVLAAARANAGDEDVPWDSAPVGIFGEACTREHVPRDGDRIELYRPLRDDPRERRRREVSNTRKKGRG